MEKLPNEILLKIFSFLEVQDLGRCATVSKNFQKIAYEKALWQKLPINLFKKEVPVKFIQHIVKHGISYLNLEGAHILGDSLDFAQPNSLKYLNFDFSVYPGVVMRNILASCTQLKKLGCDKINIDHADDISECIGQNSENLKCLQIHFEANRNYGLLSLNNMEIARLATPINRCNQLQELSLIFLSC